MSSQRASGEAVAALIATGEAALRAADYRAVHAIALEALKHDRQEPEAYFLLSMIAAAHDNFGKAAELLDRAIAIHPKRARYHAQRARCLVRLRRAADALQAAEVAAALGPSDALTLDTIGVALSHAGLHRRAIGFFQRAHTAAPANTNYLHNLGNALQFHGDMAGAAEAYLKLVALAPEPARPYAALANLSKQTPSHNYIAELESQFAKTQDMDELLSIGHALAKTFDDLGDTEKAFDWLLRAKAAKRAATPDPTPLLESQIAEGKRLYSALAASSTTSDAPIFIAGLPRTGTTLLDRVLSSHPAVEMLGELGHFPQLAARSAAAVDATSLGDAYLKAVAPLRSGAPRFTDKLPTNFLLAGAIHRALPNARIICLRRDPIDSCLSNFRQNFNAASQQTAYTYDLEWTARYYVLFDSLIAYWRERLPPDRFTEVHYEAMIDNLEGEARRLLGFCGLEWDPRCLSFHENDAPVATASSVQVRSPLYTSSVGRWRKYGDKLEPARAILANAGLL